MCVGDIANGGVCVCVGDIANGGGVCVLET